MQIKPGDTVAVLPIGTASCGDAQSIAAVAKADSEGVELVDGRHFSENDEVCMADDGLTYIVPAEPGHVAAVHQHVSKKSQPGQ